MKNFSSAFSIMFIFILQINAQDSLNCSNTFHVNKILPATPVKNQGRSNACWSFATLSFLESELIRLDKGEYNLSEMFTIWHSYQMKSDKYIRMHGFINYTGGGEPTDIIEIFSLKGIVPEEIILFKESDMVNLIELENKLKDYLVQINNDEEKLIRMNWKNELTDILNAEIGQVPDSFKFKNKSYTPQTFSENLGIDPNQYLFISSFTHHPLYKKFVIEIPDNWLSSEVLNVPIGELVQIALNSIDNGYTFVWSVDISEPGFNYYDGVINIPGLDDKRLIGDQKLTEINQENRQIGFDDHTTTDDHCMHITGTATDSNNKLYFIVKNSWGTENNFSGYLYASENYFKYKTIAILVNKEAIPVNILNKFNTNKD